jgi:hypothetical protein
MNGHIIDNERLSISDAAELGEWILKRLPMPLRGDLMAERPVLYQKLFPGVSPAAIMARVADRLQETIVKQSVRAAADADKLLADSARADRLSGAAHAAWHPDEEAATR